MAGDAATLVGDAVVDGVSAMGSAVAVRDYKKIYKDRKDYGDDGHPNLRVLMVFVFLF